METAHLCRLRGMEGTVFTTSATASVLLEQVKLG
jgi:hypothetical protein